MRVAQTSVSDGSEKLVNKPEYLDCSAEMTEVCTDVPEQRMWLAAQIHQQNWLIGIDKSAVDEIRRMATYIEDNPVQNLQRRATEFELVRCTRIIREMKSILEDGVGFAVLDRMPVDEFPIETMIEVYWVLGQLVGRPVAQKWNGQMIYDVRDTGQDYTYGVRGSHTAVELVFHTDNAFARMVPDYVGLLCRYPAASGGISRFCSLYAVHQRMHDHYPKLLRRLYRPMYFDRQKEHREGAPKVTWAPWFSWRSGRLRARANASLVRQGYAIAEQDMDRDLMAALDAIEDICNDEALWFGAPLERGQIQYLNNHEVGHYRSAFSDHDDPDRKRHLYRLWHRNAGAANYDGVPFSAA